MAVTDADEVLPWTVRSWALSMVFTPLAGNGSKEVSRWPMPLGQEKLFTGDEEHRKSHIWIRPARSDEAMTLPAASPGWNAICRNESQWPPPSSAATV